MANVIDILVSKQAQAELDKVISSLKVTHEEIIKINQQGLKFNSGASPKNPQQMNSYVKESIALNERLEATHKKMVVTSKQLEQASIRESNARNALNKQREKTLNQLAKEEQKLAVAGNYYNKLQSELNSLSFAYKDLASRQQMGANLSRVEAERMQYLEKRIKTLDTTLKGVDGAMGKYSRNVGNYAGSFNPLNNSIAQLGREMPAFANSVQTGLMAISNNLPIFFDAMENVIAQNKELQAQGKPTQSVFKQLAGALFSLQTLLSVGVTLLTLYGKEIVNWASSLWGASEALDELNKNQKEFNKSKSEGTKASISERTEVEKNLRVMRNSNLEAEKRNIALTNLRNQYPLYFKNLTDEQMLNGNITVVMKQLNQALKDRAQLNKATELVVKQKDRLEDLKQELDSVSKLEKIRQRDYEAIKKIGGTNPDIQYRAFKVYNDVQKDRLRLERDISAYDRSIARNTAVINDLKGKQIKLEGQLNKEEEKKVKLQKDLELSLSDYLSSRHALTKAQIEREIEMYDALYEDEEQMQENRLFAYDNLIKSKIKLAELSFEEEKRLNALALQDNIETLNQEYKEYIKTEGVTSSQKIKAKDELNNALSSFAKKNALDLELIELKHSDNIVEITKDMFSNILKLRQNYSKLGSLKDISEQELRDYQDYALRLDNITKSTTLKRLDEISEKEKEAIKKAQRSRLQLEIDGLSEKLQKTQTGSEEELKVKTDLYNKTKELTQLEINDLKEKEKAQRDYLKLLSDTYKGFVDEFSSQSGFGKMLDIFNGGLDKFKGNAKATALAVSEAFQEAVNTLSTMSDANYQQMYSNLKRQRDVSILFAGESTTAREEIERQYEERRKKIQRQQAESQKRLAMFNIATNTAQAIMAVFAKTPPPAGIPLALLVGAIGAAQLAMTASQPIPQFYKGTQNAPEGLAWTDEKGAELHTDKNGKIKDLGSSKGARLKKLEKGDKIYTASQTKKMMDLYGFNQDFNNIMLTNGISTSNFNNNSLNLEPLNARIDRLTNVVANKSEFTMVNNESGTRYYERVNGQRRELVNSVLTMKSRTIK